MANSIDERLLSGQDQEADAAEELKRRQRAGAGTGEEEPAEPAGGQPRSWRQRLAAARQALDVKEKAKQKLKEKVVAPVRSGLSWLLKIAWGFMLAFITFIPGVFLADLHFIGNLTLGKKIFCDFGDEWPGAKMLNNLGSAKAFKKYGELMLLAAANAIVFFVIIAILAILGWLADSIVFKILYYVGDKAYGVWEFVGGS